LNDIFEHRFTPVVHSSATWLADEPGPSLS
jgi:hypothetical protein